MQLAESLGKPLAKNWVDAFAGLILVSIEDQFSTMLNNVTYLWLAGDSGWRGVGIDAFVHHPHLDHRFLKKSHVSTL